MRKHDVSRILKKIIDKEELTPEEEVILDEYEHYYDKQTKGRFDDE